MEELDIDTTKLKKYKLISEYCTYLTTTANSAEEVLIKKGGAVKASREDLIDCIKFIQEKITECFDKGKEIIEFLNK